MEEIGMEKAISSIISLAKQSDKVEVITIPEIPNKRFVRHNGIVTEHEVPPPQRRHSIRSLSDFAAAIADKEIAKDPEIYYGLSGIQAFLDRHDRRESITLPIHLSDRWNTVRSLSRGDGMTPKDAIKLLRFSLHGSGVDGVIRALRNVDFTRTSTGKSNVTHTKESLGRAVEASVQSAEDIPEAFVLTISPATNEGVRTIQVQVQFGVFIDLEAQNIVIRPLADQIALAEGSFAMQLHDLLARALPGVPVFEGTPS